MGTVAGAGTPHWRLPGPRSAPFSLIALLVLASMLAVGARPAHAAIGYQLDAGSPKINIFNATFVRGVAVDQSSQRLYVAIVNSAAAPDGTGRIELFEPNGTPAPNSPFSIGPSAFLTGVAVNPLTGGIYVSRAVVQTPLGVVGEARMYQFSPTGSQGTSFPLANIVNNGPQIAVDSSGNVYFPNRETHTIDVFDTNGAMQASISCPGCPGGAFAWPASVAVDASNHIYVVDIVGDFVVKLKPASESYAFHSLLQSGGGAAAVAVDPSNGDVLIGSLPGGGDYHIVAYNSAGVQFDDFAADITADPDPQFGIGLAPQIAVNGTTRRVYVSDTGGVWAFERTTIPPPTAAANAATLVRQVTATLNASVDVKGHAALECKFELVNHAGFLANGFTGSTALPCPSLPNGQTSTKVQVPRTGLSPGTAYHYRVNVTTNAGSATSGEQTFETLPALPPATTTEAPSGVSKSGATLQGTVNPKGGSVSDCRFKFGTTLSYGSNFSCSSLPDPDTSAVAVNRSISGLVTGTTYHYRLVVTTNAGTSEGADVAFTATDPVIPPPDPPGGDPAPGPTPSPAPAPSPTPEATPTPTPKPPLRCKKGFRKKTVRGKKRCVKKRRVVKRRPARRR